MNPASGPKANPRQAPSPGKKPSRWPWLLALLAAAAALMLILALWAPAPQGPGRTQTGADRGQGGKTTAGPSASIPLPPEPGAGGKVVNLAPSTASDSRAEQEQARRKKTMTKVCLSCHSTQWVQGQWSRLDASIKSSDAMVAAAAGLMTRAWRQGLAQGPAQGGSPFDEYLERLWVEQWLFYANSVRYATAMMGADFGVFANGRWYTTKTVLQMKAWMDKQK